MWRKGRSLDHSKVKEGEGSKQFSKETKGKSTRF